MLEYIKQIDEFLANRQSHNFATLLNQGLEFLKEDDNKWLAQEVEMIPSVVNRWRSGNAAPMLGMQRVVMVKIKRKLLNNV